MKPDRKTNIVLGCSVVLAWGGLFSAPILTIVGLTAFFVALLMEQLLKCAKPSYGSIDFKIKVSPKEL